MRIRILESYLVPDLDNPDQKTISVVASSGDERGNVHFFRLPYTHGAELFNKNVSEIDITFEPALVEPSFVGEYGG